MNFFDYIKQKQTLSEGTLDQFKEIQQQIKQAHDLLFQAFSALKQNATTPQGQKLAADVEQLQKSAQTINNQMVAMYKQPQQQPQQQPTTDMEDWRKANPMPHYNSPRPGGPNWDKVEKWQKDYDAEAARRKG